MTQLGFVLEPSNPSTLTCSCLCCYTGSQYTFGFPGTFSAEKINEPAHDPGIPAHGATLSTLLHYSWNAPGSGGSISINWSLRTSAPLEN